MPDTSKQMENNTEQKKGFTNQEIQAIEADRKDSSTWNVIHLLRDGNYWHANEWSGWLIAVVITDEMKRRHPQDERVPPTPVKKFAKNINGEYIFVGFQEKSFDKYIPKEIQMEWKPASNLRIDVMIELPAELGELSYERLLAMCQEWKQNTPLSKERGDRGAGGARTASPGGDDALPFGSPAIVPSVMAIVTRILSFPLQKRTPMQAHEFIGELQQEMLGCIANK